MTELSTHVGSGLEWDDTGKLIDVDFGTGAGEVCEANDARLTDDRTASGIRTASTVVVVSAATAPTNGQVLQATSGTAAAWATLSGSAPATQIDEPSGPTTLNVGAITDLQLTRRNGTSFEGVTANGAAVGLGNVTNHSQLQRAAGDFSTFANKVVPTTSDVLIIEDAAAAGAKKYILIDDLPAAAPAAHASTHAPGQADAIATGTTAATVCIGNDSRLSDSRAPNGSASGDLSGTYPGPTVAKLTTTTGPTSLTIGAITDGQVLIRTSATVVGATIGSGAGTICAGNDSRLSDSRAPNGSAGGDLSGSYPNPAVAKLTTTSGPTSLTIGAWTDGQILRRSTTNATGISVGTGAGTLAAGDDSRFTDDRTASGLRTASTVVVVSAATAPSSGQVLTATSSTAATWQSPATATYPTYHFFADQLDNPVNSDWTVNSLAAASACTNNAALLVRRFANAAENGVGVMLAIPSGCTNIVFSFVSRAETTPAGTVAVIPRVYVREFPDNAAVESWSAGTDLTALSFPTNELWQYDSQTVALSTLSLVAGQTCQIELTRRGSDGSDTLTTDWTLLRFSVGFT